MQQFLTSYAALFALTASVSAIFYAIYLIKKVVAFPKGTPQMIQIADAIYEGAIAFLRRQYTVVAAIAALLFFVVAWVLGIHVATGFLVGAVASAASGIVGMHIAVRANVRVANIAKRGLAEALSLSFQGGAVTGLAVAGVALGSTALLFLIGQELLPRRESLEMLIGLGFGGSLISVFARLGGGIYTKAADVGTDMVGKIEKGIPEDDIRNPGVIADLVGDNVGDDAGMAADLFETYVVTLVAGMLLAHITGKTEAAVVFPFLVGAVALITTIIGTYFVRLGNNHRVMPALYKGFAATIITALIALYPLTTAMVEEGLFGAIIAGFAVAILMVIITEYYTGKNSQAVIGVAKASQTGHGTNIIAGLALSLQSTFAPILVIGTAMIISYQIGQLYGVAIAAMAMLSLAGIIISIDAFGPITDNAGGIAEMSGLPEKTRKVTDTLDSVGNTTKAVTKAYAIGSAGLAALVLFAAYTEELAISQTESLFSLSNPFVLVGLFFGASLPYLFASFAMQAVGKAASAIVDEIRRQFREIKGILEGQTKPQYDKCVDIVTRAALRQMLIPSLLPVLAPIVVGFALGPQALGGLLMGTIVTGLFVAISMTTGGAAWDNAKKYIEDGNLGGKGGFAHQAAVTGDTVGDPYKDTAGPAINPMIKVANIVALLIAPLLL